MDLFQLKYFKAAAEVESISKAANQLYVSPPAVSVAINKLENELGVRLFEREGRNIALTEFGKVYLKRINNVFRELEFAQQEVSALRTVNDKCISVALTAPFVWSMPFNYFTASHPELTVSQSHITPEAIRSPLLFAKYDFLITDLELIDNPAWECFEPDTGFDPILRVYEGHRFFSYNQIDLREARKERFVALSTENYSRVYTDRLFELAGFKPNIVLEGNLFHLLQLVKKGFGLFISTAADPSMPSLIPEELKGVRIVWPEFKRHFVICRDPRNEQNSAGKQFLSFMSEYFKH